MPNRLLPRIATALVCAGLALAAGAALGRESPRTTVTIDSVRYTLPSYVEAARIEPKNPLCYDYEYSYMLIKDRELFINGVSRYLARPGDEVVVTFPEDVRVNGAPTPAQNRPALDGARPCAP